MRAELLMMVGGVLVTAGCNGRDGGRANPVDSVVNRSSLQASASRDTFIMHGSSAKDTFVMHITASAADSCLRIPKPPECPSYLRALRIDTIPRP